MKTIKTFILEMVLWLLLLKILGLKIRGQIKVDAFRKKLMIPESEILKFTEHEIKSKIGNIFVNEKMLEEYSVKILEIDAYFYKHYKKIFKKLQTDKNGSKYILFGIDVYFTEYLLAVEVDEKGHIDRDLNFEKKRQDALKKKSWL